MNEFAYLLDDRGLQELNGLLPWFSGTALPDGRIVGRLDARPGKRESVQAVPDKRITRLHEALDLSDKSVLEVGCFEGIHTLGLLQYCPDVTAIDVRPLNVVKTLARLSAHGCSAQVYTVDVEQVAEWRSFDVVFHCGVLYHLENPVEHLQALLPHCQAIYLDTHVAEAGRDQDVATFAGRSYRGYRHAEGGWTDPYSGRGGTAFWLRLADIEEILAAAGFAVEIWSSRNERNGARVGLLGTRMG